LTEIQSAFCITSQRQVATVSIDVLIIRKNQVPKQVQWLGGRFSNPQLHKAVDVVC
jgi:hypothetical protein